MSKTLILVNKLGNILLQKKISLTVAESCTGGLLAAYITQIPGCSKWFERGFVTYSNLAKQEMLAVPCDLIDKYGAVSEEVVSAMARGALVHSSANVSVAVSGIAGPDGGTTEKPIGTVWAGFANKGINNICIQTNLYKLAGDRSNIRELAVYQCINDLIKFVQDFCK